MGSSPYSKRQFIPVCTPAAGPPGLVCENHCQGAFPPDIAEGVMTFDDPIQREGLREGLREELI